MNVIPNNICEGLGETSIEERIGPWLQDATLWFEANISPQSLLDKDMKSLADTIIQCRALWCAAPALDVTMHPNGLAVVNTDSLAPASAERSREFRKSIMNLMLSSIENLLKMLLSFVEWRKSGPAKDLWLSTTFNLPDEVFDAVECERDWDSLVKAFRKIRDTEDADAVTVWAPEMLEVLRSAGPAPRRTPNPLDAQALEVLRRLVRSSVRFSLRADEAQDRFFKADCYYRKSEQQEYYVNLCKSGIDVCKPWADSRTALLYSPVVFRNEKGSSGYFF